MDEYIKREEAVDAVLDAYFNTPKTNLIGKLFYNAILELQPADVEPVKHGRWEWFEEWSYSTPEHSAECDDCGWRCSECKTKLEDMVNGYYDDSYEVPQLNYCPNCGARMDGE